MFCLFCIPGTCAAPAAAPHTTAPWLLQSQQHASQILTSSRPPPPCLDLCSKRCLPWSAAGPCRPSNSRPCTSDHCSPRCCKANSRQQSRCGNEGRGAGCKQSSRQVQGNCTCYQGRDQGRSCQFHRSCFRWCICQLKLAACTH